MIPSYVPTMGSYTDCSKNLNHYNTCIHTVHFTSNTPSNVRTYSTNDKTSKGFNTILTYFVYV
jgi:hypothetical protein